MERSDLHVYTVLFVLAAAVAIGAAVSMAENPHGLFAFLAGEFILTVGVWTWWRAPDRALGTVFLWMCLCLASYSWMLFGQYILDTPGRVGLWTMVVGAGYYFMTPATLHFSFRLAELRDRRHPILLTAAYASAAFFWGASIVGLFPLDFQQTGVKFSLVLSPWYSAQLAFTLVLILILLGELLLRLVRLQRGIKRIQIGWFLAAIFLTACLAFTNPLAATPLKTYPLAGFALSFLTSVLAYLVIKHRFLDVHLVLRKATVWALWTFAVAGAYGLILSLFGLFLDVRPLSTQAANLAAIVLAAFLLYPLRTAVQNLVDRRFFRRRYDARRTLEELSTRVVALLDGRNICRTVLDTVVDTFPSEGAWILLFLEGQTGVTLLAERLSGKAFRYLDPGAEVFDLPGGSWTEDPTDLEAAPLDVTAPLERFGAVLSMPLSAAKGPSGVLLLGPKRSGLPYNEEDRGVLKTIANQTAVALSNAALYQNTLALKTYNEDVIESMDSGLFTVDDRGRIISTNGAALSLLDLAPEEKPDSLEDLPDGAAPVRDELASVLAGHPGRAGLEFAIGHRTFSLASAPIRDHLGQRVGALASFTDVTDTLSMREALERNRRLVMLGEMASRVAHEIKNPLASLKLIVSPLERRLDDPDYRSRLARVVPAEIDRLDHILKDLLDYSRPARLVRVPTDPGAIIRASLESLAGQIDAQGIEAKTDMDTPAGPLLLDGEQFKQVVVNLIKNAVEAVGDAASPRIEIALKKTESGGAVVTVQDNGPGIDPTTVERIFHPFFSTKTTGSGLGLSVVQKIVEAHGGRVLVDAPADGGARFRIDLPPPD